ncbi:RUN and SH3 domain-containing protein 1 isoform X2 [Xenopus laevis]|uniref:RUN and SH3 domain-containing protein 1 isoform X2 n=1 Tax=Xenopus laevis TaxID=8355 RepID=A0A8J1LM19_XENLA|nr:RUN and SH3 domain-containing protein 1 isoform X2 [Xenopus laevis]
MLAPRKGLLGNLNYVHLQHVSLGVQLSLWPELMEGPFTKGPGKEEELTSCFHCTKEGSAPKEVDANSNDPSVPCQCCDQHPGQGNTCNYSPRENMEPKTSDDELLSPSDPPLSPFSPHSNSSSSSDFTLDDSPVSMYFREFLEDGCESPDHQPEIIPLDSSTGELISSMGLSSQDHSLCLNNEKNQYNNLMAMTQEISKNLNIEAISKTWGSGSTLDANCNAVPDCHTLNFTPLDRAMDKGDIDNRAEAVSSTKKDNGPSAPELSEESEACTQSYQEAEDYITSVSMPGLSQSPRKNITSFHELAQKRRRSGGVPPALQGKKDKSDWLIMFSPDTEHPPINELTCSDFFQRNVGSNIQTLPAGKETITFKELRYCNALVKQSSLLTKCQPDGQKEPLQPSGGQRWPQNTAGEKGPQIPVGSDPGLRCHSEEHSEIQEPSKKDKALHDPPAGEFKQHSQTMAKGDNLRLSFRDLGPQRSCTGVDNSINKPLHGAHTASPLASLRDFTLGGGYFHCTFLSNRLEKPQVVPCSKPTTAKNWIRGMADGGDKRGREVRGASQLWPQASLSPHVLAPLSAKPTLLCQFAPGNAPAPQTPGLPLPPTRLSPLGAFSPPYRGLLPMLDPPEFSVLMSPLYPRSRTHPRLTTEEAAPQQDSPAAAAHTQLMAGGREESLLRDKKGLLVAIGSSVDKIIGHFNSSRNHVQKAQLGDSRLSPELGHLLLGGLCPSLYSLLADGLKPFHRDIIVGRRRLSPWSLVEASVVRAGAGPLHTLLCNIGRLSQLRDPRRRFNAFVFGLLNTKQVDSWVSLLHQSYDSLCLFFAPTGFLPLAVRSERGLLDELVVTLQPLSALTFHVDLLFEHHHLPLHEAPHPWGRPSLQDILSLGGWITPTPTPTGPCARLPPQDSGTSWWGQLSRASRIYLPPETFSSHWNKPTHLGGPKKLDAEPTETPPELSDTSAPPTDQTGDSAPSMGDTEWSSGAAEEPAEKNQQNSPHIAPSAGERGGVWLGHLFGAKPSPTQAKKKSRTDYLRSLEGAFSCPTNILFPSDCPPPGCPPV